MIHGVEIGAVEIVLKIKSATLWMVIVMGVVRVDGRDSDVLVVSTRNWKQLFVVLQPAWESFSHIHYWSGIRFDNLLYTIRRTLVFNWHKLGEDTFFLPLYVHIVTKNTCKLATISEHFCLCRENTRLSIPSRCLSRLISDSQALSCQVDQFNL